MRRIVNRQTLLEYGVPDYANEYVTFSVESGCVRVVSTVVSRLTSAQARHIAKWLIATAERLDKKLEE